MRYIVKDTHIRRGETTYGPDDVIELTGEEAAPIGHHLEPIEDAVESSIDGIEAEDGRKKRLPDRQAGKR